MGAGGMSWMLTFRAQPLVLLQFFSPTCPWFGVAGGSATLCPVFGAHLFQLERLGPSGWVIEDFKLTPTSFAHWSNLAPGSYRVRVSRSSCLNSVPAFNYPLLQEIGTVGIWLFVGYTNIAVLGTVTSPSAILIDEDEGFTNIGWDQNEQVLLDCSGTTGHDRYFLAIFELNGAQRYASTGWRFTTDILPTFDLLQEVWKGASGNPTWNFEVGNFYRVQFVASNPCQSVWNPVPLPDFFICAPNAGCRFNFEPSQKEVITFFPNPTSDRLSLVGLNSSHEYKVTLHDLSGRQFLNEQLTGTEVYVSDYPNGLYLLRLHDEETGNVTVHKVQVSH